MNSGQSIDLLLSVRLALKEETNVIAERGSLCCSLGRNSWGAALWVSSELETGAESYRKRLLRCAMGKLCRRTKYILVKEFEGWGVIAVHEGRSSFRYKVAYKSGGRLGLPKLFKRIIVRTFEGLLKGALCEGGRYHREKRVLLTSFVWEVFSIGLRRNVSAEQRGECGTNPIAESR